MVEPITIYEEREVPKNGIQIPLINPYEFTYSDIYCDNIYEYR